MLIPFLILVSLAAGAVSTIAIVNEPKTSQLSTRIDSLSGQLTKARAQISALKTEISSSASATNVSHINRSLLGLRRTVGGTQNSIVQLRAELQALRVCAPQLQQELTGIAAHAGKRGVTTVIALSPQCSQLLGGG
jgi:septal ring factor EnvC (AmiA/AmiB activator)